MGIVADVYKMEDGSVVIEFKSQEHGGHAMVAFRTMGEFCELADILMDCKNKLIEQDIPKPFLNGFKDDIR